MKRTLLPLVIFTLLMAACGSPSEATPTPAPAADDFSAVISATGVVIPARWAALSVHSQGVIREVLVAEGERVQAGQLLLQLDGQDTAQAKLRTAEAERLSAQQALDLLRENAAAATALARQAVALALQAVVDTGRALDPFDEQQYDDDLERAREALVDAEDDLKTAREDFEPYADLDEDNATRKNYENRLEDAQQKYDDALRDLQELEADKEQAIAAFELAQGDLARAEAEYARRKDGPDTNLLALAQARLAQAEAQVNAAGEALANLELRAPFAGVVSNLDARVGEWVAPGMVILQIGDSSRLQVETTDLSEIDAARVRAGDPVSVTFDALPDVVINGTVLWVAQKSSKGSGVNYTTVIVLDSIPPGLRWGMTAFADIEVSP